MRPRVSIAYFRLPVLAPVLKSYYAKRQLVPFEYRRLPEPQYSVSHEKFIVTFILPKSGAKPKVIALERTVSGLKVDWESWVGYAEVSW